MNPLSHLQADWPAISRLLDEALELPPAERSAWMAALPADVSALKDIVAGLLAATGGVETSDLLHTLPKLSVTGPGGAANGAQAGAEVGPWRLLRELGEGGMGSVWLAERADGQLKRQVALKLPRLTWARGLAERMARERDILATLEHPHIARLYDAGVDVHGRPWLALEHVLGRPIDDHCREHGLDVRQRVHLLQQVCEAVAYAHSRLVIHRDLKPGNILVTADGQVKLLDFGIAKLLEAESPGPTALTELQGRPLTLNYASPEQVCGQQPGTASDVYSLGLVAYEVLCGARPYRLHRHSMAELEEAITSQDPPAASGQCGNAADRRVLRGDLDAVLHKALKKLPAERYATVDAFGADLRRWQQGLPVLAQPDRLGYRLRKFVRRHRAAVLLASLAGGAVVGAAATAVVQAQRAGDQADRARAVQQFLLSVFGDANPDGAGRADVTALELLQQASRRLERSGSTNAALESELRGALGASLLGLGALPEAEATLRQAAERSRLAFGPADARTLEADLRVVEALLAGDRHEAAQLLLDALEGSEHLVAHPAQRIDALRLRALLMQRLNQARDGLALARQAADLARDLRPVDHRLVARVQAQLASLLDWVRQPGAVEAAQAALSALSAAGEDMSSGSALQLRALLVRVLPTEGRYVEAVQAVDEVVKAHRAIYGPQHPALANALNAAGIARAQLEPHAALRDLADAQGIFDKLSGGRPNVDGTINRVPLALQQLEVDDPAAALRTADAGLAQSRTLLGDTHGVTMALWRLRLQALARQGRVREALAELPAIEADAAERPRRRQSMHALRAELRLLQGRPAEAEADARQAIAEMHLPTDVLLHDARLLLARALVEQSRADEAEPVLRALAAGPEARVSPVKARQAASLLAALERAPRIPRPAASSPPQVPAAR